MPRALPLFAATVSTVLTAPALLSGGAGFLISAPVGIGLPGIAMARG